MAPAASRGTAFGIYNAALGIGDAGGEPAVRLIWTRVSPQAAFLTGAALAVAATVLLYLLTFRNAAHVSMKRILVTNDDGVHSDGIHALAAALARLGEVTIVAPHIEASAIGHALTLRRPLRMEQLRDGVYEVDGTPTDCVNVAITQLFRGAMPDLVVSGINKGYNLGDDVTYSGTVAGAMEGALLGIPSIAVSLERSAGRVRLQPCGRGVRGAWRRRSSRAGCRPRTFLNINVPTGPPKGCA